VSIFLKWPDAKKIYTGSNSSNNKKWLSIFLKSIDANTCHKIERLGEMKKNGQIGTGPIKKMIGCIAVLHQPLQPSPIKANSNKSFCDFRWKARRKDTREKTNFSVAIIAFRGGSQASMLVHLICTAAFLCSLFEQRNRFRWMFLPRYLVVCVCTR